MRSVYVIGVGMTPFSSPRVSPSYLSLGATAIQGALSDSGIGFDSVEQVFAGYVYGDSCSGHRVVHEVGLSGIPIFNVNSNCSSGSSALYLACQSIRGGENDCVLAVGFEQMPSGAVSEHWQDRPTPLEVFERIASSYLTPEQANVPVAPKLFAAAAREYQEKYGLDLDSLAAVSVKNRRHAADNPLAFLRDPVSCLDVLSSPSVCDPLTRLQCCPPTCGSAAVVLCSESFLKRHSTASPVRIAAIALVTDRSETFSGSAMEAVGSGLARIAGEAAFREAAVSRSTIQVAEVHDCFTINEILACEALGLFDVGDAEAYIESGANSYGGTCVVNSSGGLLSKGHPLGATGLAQCFEITKQLRGTAEPSRQVNEARWGLAHNIGVGSTCVVTLFEGNGA